MPKARRSLPLLIPPSTLIGRCTGRILSLGEFFQNPRIRHAADIYLGLAVDEFQALVYLNADAVHDSMRLQTTPRAP